MTPQPHPSVLLLGQDADLAQAITDALRAFDYEVVRVQGPEEALERLKAAPLDAMVLDLDCPCAEDAPDCLERVAAIRPFTLPFVVLLGTADIRLTLRAIRSGCSAILTKPVDFQDLAERLATLIHPPVRDPYRVLVVEDSRAQALYLEHLLEGAGMKARVVLEPLKALDELAEFQPDLILLDHYMPGCDGPELAALIRLNPANLSIPIVYFSTEMDAGKQLRALREGADDFLTKNIEPEHLISAIQIRAERTRLLRGLMLRDSLTSLLNHTTLKFRLQEEVQRAQRHALPLCYAMVDIDHFKAVNDTHGHAVGDHVLMALSSLLQRRLRKSDIIGRYGGEEFGVVLPQTGLEDARIILERLREACASLPHRGASGPFHVTFSCGIAPLRKGWTAEQLNAVADAALYEAKRGGRNRVVTAAGD